MEKELILRVAKAVSQHLQIIGRETVLIIEDMIVSWSACSLKK
jgi:hypothetical protein